jgi:competence protein ComEA
MSVGKSLWEVLDSSSSSTRLVDSHEEGLSDNYFAPDDTVSRFRWKIGLAAGLALVGAVVLIAVGAHVVRQAAPVPETIVLPPTSTDESAAQSVTPSPAVVFVHVVGAVHEPGVIELPENSRVLDALNRVGGATLDADLTGINLARIVYDGEQIVVPRPGEAPVMSAEGSTGGPLSLSRADQATLETLPRVGPATAQRIIAWREKNGPFVSVDDLLAVSGIGPATLEGLRDRVVP